MGTVAQGQQAGDRFGEGEPERCSRGAAAQPLAVETLALEFQRAQMPGADGFFLAPNRAVVRSPPVRPTVAF